MGDPCASSVSRGKPLGDPRETRERPMSYPWVTHGLSVGCPRETHGQTMAVPWVIRG